MKKAAYPGCCKTSQSAHAGKEYATMTKSTSESYRFPEAADASDEKPRDVLTEKLREGAQQMLARAIGEEVEAYVSARTCLVDDDGRQQVVRNGYLPQRKIMTGLGPVEVQQPRVRDRRPAHEREKFTSSILPPYLRKTKSVEELLPWLYLKGVSTGDFGEALQTLLGENAKGLSATTITRLKSVWEDEYKDWSKRSLADKHYVYVWADGIHFNVRLEDPDNRRQCILVLMGATADGKKELIAVNDGYRESAASWKEILLDCRNRGLGKHRGDPKLAIGDGALGFWAAIDEVWPDTQHQRCWVHKTSNVLNKMPKSLHGKAKAMLHDIWMAETRAEATKAFGLFVETFEAKYPKAAECLVKDREALLAFYSFPAEHWSHVRTTNPIESTFSTVRSRTNKTKGSGSRIACLTMVFKLVQSAEKRWRALNGSALIPMVIAGIQFVDGLKNEAA
ncbi:MAG: IS256 family transposase [SAR202 cluster bacterium]|jgi:transposase-like protein|nr:IS256 family transposase [SAR202 cluster bacterium]|tara:strand:- start:178 stop:1530 length:1353 start_codon:yes stop_codon:yes gene_type:complete